MKPDLFDLNSIIQCIIIHSKICELLTFKNPEILYLASIL